MSVSSERFLRLATSGDYSTAVAAYNEYMISHCCHPKRIEIYDSHLGKRRFIQVPCGSCYHCKESKVNEWVTRMYAHCEDFKYVYFITLTYTSFYQSNSPISKLMLEKLNAAIWHYDNVNMTRRYCWRPTLLVKKHYQDFMKRLRKQTNNDSITYVLCGEYGKKYGAPHFHAILFSQVPITAADVKRAWSVSLWQDNSGSWSFRTSQKNNGRPFNVSIGRTDFNDLVTNGTFNTRAKVKVDYNFMNAAHCFAYVCKYVCKRDDANLKRVYMAFNALWKKQDFVKVFDNEVQFDIVKDYLFERGYRYEQLDNVYSNLKSLKYEKFIPYESERIYSQNLSRQSQSSLYGYPFTVENYPSFIGEFVCKYSPFVEFSRGTPIGSIYAKSHLSEFVSGVFNKPLLQEKGFVCPRYFARKADQSVYGLRKVHTTVKSSSFTMGSLPALKRQIEDSLSHPDSFSFCVPLGCYGSSIKEIIRSSGRAFTDLSTGYKIIFTRFSKLAISYKYDRSLKRYIKVDSVPMATFLRGWLSVLSDEYSRYNEKVARARKNAHDEDAALCIMNDYVDTDSLLQSFLNKQSVEQLQRQIVYDCTHDSLE